MAKIYNEVVIDMNPESPTFEEILYEDSYEYSGDDMMLAQGDPFSGESVYYKTDPGMNNSWSEYKWKPSEQKFVTMRSGLTSSQVDVNAIIYYSKDAFNEATGATTSKNEAGENVTKYTKSTDYGLESLSKKDFFQADGTTPLPKEDILALLKKHKPDVSDLELLSQIEDMMPKLQGVSEEERGFAREGFQKDVYGISKPGGVAEKAGKQMQQAYGSGMGSQMRGAYGAQKDVAQQFKQAEQGYAQDVYGLEQKAEGEFESDVSTWLQGFKQGGRVPNKRQTFSEILSKIPDAGGN